MAKKEQKSNTDLPESANRPQLVIHNLHVSIEHKEILHGVSLTVPKGEVHAIMGPNGSGKSTLSYALLGHPKYQVTEGSITFKRQDVLTLTPDKRANLGLFLAFQQPHSIPGVKIGTFLKRAEEAKRRCNDPKQPHLKIREYKQMLHDAMDRIHMKHEFADRYLNTGFSGGEKKKSEILQMAILQPDIAVLDEIDSGLDVDALRVVAEGVNELRRTTGMGVLIITHYPRILQYIQPDAVHVLIDGSIVRTGAAELAHQIEKDGYNIISA